MNIYDIIGYSASLLIAISMAMHSILRLRIIGLSGSLLFVIYGFFIHSYPVIILNLFTSTAHIFYLIQLKRHTEYFEMMRIPSIDSPFLIRFINFYKKEILSYFPDFNIEQLKNPIILLLFRNMKPASLIYCRTTE